MVIVKLIHSKKDYKKHLSLVLVTSGVERKYTLFDSKVVKISVYTIGISNASGLGRTIFENVLSGY